MKTCLAICLTLLSTRACASCDKIDYVEVKDWSAAKLEQAYCKAQTEKYRLMSESNELVKRDINLYRSPQYLEYEVGMESCDQQSALYERVLEKHKRKMWPAKCK